MNIYTCYTPSHFKLYWRYFCPTVCFDVSVVAKKLPGIGDGKYKNQYWAEATRLKLEMIIEIIDNAIDDIFVFCDVDVQLFGPITDLIVHEIIDKDIITQKDPSKDYEFMYCTGFMAIRMSEKVRAFFTDVLEYMALNPECDDQDAFNVVARRSELRFGTFDENIVWSHRKMWRPGTAISFPDEMLVHHANWTFSIDHKIAQMETVSKLYAEKFGGKFLIERTKNFRNRNIVN